MARKQPRLWRRKKEVSRGEEEVIGCRCPGGGGWSKNKNFAGGGWSKNKSEKA